MDLQLQNKLCVVTGSTGDGIGFCIAKELTQHGAYVVVNGRSNKTVEEAVKNLGGGDGHDSNRKVIGIPGDVSTSEGASAFIAELEQVEVRIGEPVEVLINNVGIFHSQDLAQVTDEQWDQYYQVNTMSGVRLSRHFLPKMLARKNGHGRILFVSSESALKPLGNMIPYSVSKASQVNLARGLAELTKGSTVTVNSLLPGPTMTGGVQRYMKDWAAQHGYEDSESGMDLAIAAYFREAEPTSLIQRFLKPQEVANVAVFLSSPLAAGINGVAQRVDGGLVRHI